MRNNKGLILTITIVFVLILVIMSGVVLLLMTNHVRVTESQIKRVKSVDTAESAALVKAYEELRTNTCIPTRSPCSPGNFTTAIDGLNVTVVTRAAGVGGCNPPGGQGNCVVANITY